MTIIDADFRSFRELFPEYETYFVALDEIESNARAAMESDDDIETDDDDIETDDDDIEMSINVVTDDATAMRIAAVEMEASIKSAINVSAEIHRHHPRPIAQLYLAAHIVATAQIGDDADSMATLSSERIGPYESEYQKIPDTAKKTRITYLQSTRYGRVYMQLVGRYPTGRAAPLVST